MRTWRRLCLLLLVVMTLGCSKQAAPVQEEESLGPLLLPGAARVEPPQGKVLHLHLAKLPESVDPALATSQTSLDVISNLYEGLVRSGPRGELVPAAADGWTCQGSQCTFYLRSSAYWSDGEPLTAQDFVNAWLRVLDPRSGSPHAYLLLDIEGARNLHLLDPADPDFETLWHEWVPLFGAQAVDDKTLTVRLHGSGTDFVPRTALAALFPTRHSGVDHRQVFNGPFTLQGRGQRLWLVRNEHYWDVGQVRLDEVHLKVEPDAGRALEQYRAGRLDYVRVPGEGFEHYHGWGLRTQAMGVTFYVVPNTEHPVLKFGEARLALSLALDRQALAAGAFHHGAIAASGFVPPSLSGTREETYRELAGELLSPQAELATARAYWQGALELSQLERVTLRLLYLPASEAQVKALKAAWEEALPGLTIQLQSVTLQERLGQVRRGDFDLVYQAWVTDIDDPLEFLTPMVTAAVYNDARWSNTAYDRAVKEAGRASSPQERVALAAQAESILLAEAAVIPIAHPVSHYLIRHGVTGITHHPATGIIDLKSADTATTRAKSPIRVDPDGAGGDDYPL